MAEQKEASGPDWADRSEKVVTWALFLLTLLYGVWIYQVFGSDVWILTQYDRMGEAGDFIAGFTTPVVFLWLIYGYFLQRRELSLQRKELREMQKALGKQAAVMERQADAERQGSAPSFSFRVAAILGDERKVELINVGGPAHDLELILDGTTERLNRLASNHPHSLMISCGHHSYEVRSFSAHNEKFYQHWKIEISRSDAPPSFWEVTEGPTRCD